MNTDNPGPSRSAARGCRTLLVSVLAAVVLITGCGEKRLRDRLAEEGYPPVYIDGYVEGCSSGLHDAGDEAYAYVKSMARFRAEHRYAEGWETGYEYCLKRQKSFDELLDITGDLPGD